MITTGELDRLKKLLATAAPTPLSAAPMDSRGQRWTVSTVGAGKRLVATGLTRGDAEMMVAAWAWLPKLIAEVALRPKPSDQLVQGHVSTPEGSMVVAGSLLARRTVGGRKSKA